LTIQIHTPAELSNEDYHKSPAIGSTGLKLIIRSPAHFRYQEPVEHDTRAKQIGTALHCAILEPDRFARDYLVAQCDDRRSALYKGLAADAGGDRVITMTEHRRITSAQSAAYRNKKVRELLEYPGRYELSVHAKCPETGVAVKCRFDKKLDDLRAFDLKKTQDARPSPFGRSIDGYMYHLSVAYYMDVWYWATGERIKAMPLIAIEEKSPHACMIHALPDDWIQQGRYEYQQALRIYAECLDKDEWPSYDEEECIAEMPAWRIRELEEEIEIGGLGDE
jgi:exodeoxyribonuclease VIII